MFYRFLSFPPAQIVIWVIAAIGAALLFARTRSWPTILIFVGSAANVIGFGTLTTFEFAFHHHWILADSPLWKDRTLISAIDVVFAVATLLIAVGLLLHGLWTKRHI